MIFINKIGLIIEIYQKISKSIMEAEQCYICYDEASVENPFAVNPCDCKGSIKIHRGCLTTIMNNTDTCAVCFKTYNHEWVYYGGLRLITKEDSYLTIQYTIDSDGKKHGLYKEYDGNYRCYFIETYNHGLREGIKQRILFPIKKDLLVTYINGNKEGYKVTSDYKHNVINKHFYKHNNLHGLYKEYDKEGNILYIGMYNNGIIEGLYQDFNGSYMEEFD